MTTQVQNEKNRKNRKGLIGLAAAATAGALVLGLGWTFFSDTLSEDAQATAGTLDISAGAFSLVQESSEGTIAHDDLAVENLNPGDTLTMNGTVANGGNKSAWIRSAINVPAADAEIAGELYVYTGETVPAYAGLVGK